VGRHAFDDAGSPQSANPRKARLSEERRERDNAFQDPSDRIPMPLKLIIAALMGASRG
jgi:hypothetical protein